MKLAICGNVQSCRTEVEISAEDNSELDPVAIVYETADGWVTELTDQNSGESLGEQQLQTATMEARERLSHYVNRRGENMPDGLTPASLSFWLMHKDDGTAMGVKLGD
jgi:hypothetical protein